MYSSGVHEGFALAGRGANRDKKRISNIYEYRVTMYWGWYGSSSGHLLLYY